MSEHIKKRIIELRAELLKWSDTYYNTESETVPDSVFNAAMQTLRELEIAYPEYAVEDSPTATVGAPARADDTTAPHVVSMLSLDNIFSPEGMLDWFQKTADHAKGWLAEYKLDGLSLSLTYVYGTLVMAQLRGDGESGIVVTERAKEIESIPKRLDGSMCEYSDLTVRGEVVVAKEHLAAINDGRSKPYTTTRSAAAAGLRGSDLTPIHLSSLVFSPYEVFADDRKYIHPTQTAAMEALHDSHFYIHSPRPIPRPSDSDAMSDVLDELNTLMTQCRFDCDGIVFKVDNTEAWPKLGMTAKHPNYMIAYKYQSPGVLTKLVDINWQVGRTGVVTPVGSITPTIIGGVTVTNCNLANPTIIANHKLSLGDIITVIRSGEVIPKFISRTSKPRAPSKRVQIPPRCPSCDTGLVFVGPKIYCPGGQTCPAQKETAIVHYGSRKALNIHGLGPAVVSKLIEAGQIASLVDLYELSPTILADLIGTANAKSLIAEIETKKRTTPERFLYALGIPQIGLETARSLLKHFGSISDVFSARVVDLLEVPDVGTERANAVAEFYSNTFNAIAVEKLLDYLDLEEVKVGSTLAGKIFVITGSFGDLTREELKAQLEAEGAKVTNSVSYKTTMLLVGDKPSGSKVKKAAELNIQTAEGVAVLDLIK